MTNDVYTIKTGSDGEAIFYQFAPTIDLAGAAAFFSMAHRQSGTVKISAAAATIANGTYEIDGVSTVLVPADGVVFYAWALADLDTPGDYEGEFKIVKAGKATVSPSKGRKAIQIEAAIA